METLKKQIYEPWYELFMRIRRIQPNAQNQFVVPTEKKGVKSDQLQELRIPLASSDDDYFRENLVNIEYTESENAFDTALISFRDPEYKYFFKDDVDTVDYSTLFKEYTAGRGQDNLNPNYTTGKALEEDKVKQGDSSEFHKSYEVHNNFGLTKQYFKTKKAQLFKPLVDKGTVIEIWGGYQSPRQNIAHWMTGIIIDTEVSISNSVPVWKIKLVDISVKLRLVPTKNLLTGERFKGIDFLNKFYNTLDPAEITNPEDKTLVNIENVDSIHKWGNWRNGTVDSAELVKSDRPDDTLTLKEIMKTVITDYVGMQVHFSGSIDHIINQTAKEWFEKYGLVKDKTKEKRAKIRQVLIWGDQETPYLFLRRFCFATHFIMKVKGGEVYIYNSHTVHYKVNTTSKVEKKKLTKAGKPILDEQGNETYENILVKDKMTVVSTDKLDYNTGKQISETIGTDKAMLLFQNQKMKALQDEFGMENFRVVYPDPNNKNDWALVVDTGGSSKYDSADYALEESQEGDTVLADQVAIRDTRERNINNYEVVLEKKGDVYSGVISGTQDEIFNATSQLSIAYDPMEFFGSAKDMATKVDKVFFYQKFSPNPESLAAAYHLELSNVQQLSSISLKRNKIDKNRLIRKTQKQTKPVVNKDTGEIETLISVKDTIADFFSPAAEEAKKRNGFIGLQ